MKLLLIKAGHVWLSTIQLSAAHLSNYPSLRIFPPPNCCMDLNHGLIDGFLGDDFQYPSQNAHSRLTFENVYLIPRNLRAISGGPQIVYISIHFGFPVVMYLIQLKLWEPIQLPREDRS